MVCGGKWKTCDCPWFNYDTGEEGWRVRIAGLPPIERVRIEGVRPIERVPPGYVENLQRRRRLIEENTLRRFEAITLEDNGHHGRFPLRGRGGGGVDVARRIAEDGLENDMREYDDNHHPVHIDQATAAASHAMGVARDRNSASGAVPRRQIHRPLPLRRHTLREQVYNSAPSTRPSERVIPRRIRRDYESEAAVHAPVRTHERSASTDEHPTPSRATLAGLRGNGRGSNRVSAWRKHVEPGVEPEEGVLSM